MANRYAILPAATTSLYSATSTWSDSSGGATGASVPTPTDSVYVDALSVAGAGAILRISTSGAVCLNMDWTGATNSPQLLINGGVLNFYGSLTFIAAMTVTGSDYGLVANGSLDTMTITSNGLTINRYLDTGSFTGTLTLNDALSLSSLLYHNSGTVVTNNQTVTLTGVFNLQSAGVKTLTLGSSTINCVGWNYSGSNLTLTANTATINVSGTGAFAGGAITTYNNINLNGTAHTVSGAFTCVILTRNGTATKTDSVTFTSGTTLTCTTCAMIGNSATNRLLVQSSTLGTAAIITATNWTGTVNVDIMDITATNAINLSAITGLSGDCGGNTGITFTVAAAQTWDGTTASWSTAARWTSRVPLPQDDVTAGGAGITITVDMPRIGASITFTGTPTVSLSNDISNYGSLTLVSGMTYTHNLKVNYFRGRGAYTLTSAGIFPQNITINAPNGTVTLQDDLGSVNVRLILLAGTLTTNDKTVSARYLWSTGTLTRVLNLGSSTFTVAYDGLYTDAPQWNVIATGLTINAGTSTIIMTKAGADAQLFGGAGFTYNNLTIAGAGNYALTITGNNTFNVFTVDRSVAAKTITIIPGSVQAFTAISLPVNGVVVITLNTGGAACTLTKPNANLVVSDYLNLTNCAATQLKTFYAGTHSTDGGGNTNWIFGNPQPITKAGPIPSLLEIGVL